MGFNTGVMVVQPSRQIFEHMLDAMQRGVLDHHPVLLQFGFSDQPWLDAWWLENSHRQSLVRREGDTLVCPPHEPHAAHKHRFMNTSHCLLPVESTHKRVIRAYD